MTRSSSLYLSVDISHWLDEDGEPVPSLRRKVLWIARMIEYAAALDPGFSRETLIECSLRPSRRACPGLLWVRKSADGSIESWCPHCERLQVRITGWQDTVWADGPMEPVGPADSSRAH